MNDPHSDALIPKPDDKPGVDPEDDPNCPMPMVPPPHAVMRLGQTRITIVSKVRVRKRDCKTEAVAVLLPIRVESPAETARTMCHHHATKRFHDIRSR